MKGCDFIEGYPGTGVALADPEEFVRAFDGMAAAFHANARAKGFWDRDGGDAEKIALMHSELSEALESIRHGHPADKHCPEFTNTEIEFADLMIRAMETCYARGYRLAKAILAKHAYNATRPYRHGKAF